MINIQIMHNENLTSAEIEALPFGEAEKKRIYDLRSLSRKKESIGGLMALAELINSANTPCADIIRAVNGKPYFNTANALPFGISHSHGFSAAALATADCIEIGFDIELVRSINAEGIARRFFSPRELTIFENGGRTAEAFFIAWTEKEAIAKLSGNGLLENHYNITSRENISICHACVQIGNDRIMLCTAYKAKEHKMNFFVDGEKLSNSDMLFCTENVFDIKGE